MFRRLTTSLFVLAIAAVAWSASAEKASAQMFGGGGYGLGFFNYGAQNFGGNYRIPYYALFPPVYYSYPVPRTYGYSPFAYPPGVMTPEIEMEKQGAIYHNPYVPKAKATADQTASQPRMYLNPYVKQNDSTLAATSKD